MAFFAITAAKLNKNATINISHDPSSLKKALKGAKKLHLLGSMLSVYPPRQITTIPRIPQLLGISFKNKLPVPIINIGVKARKGTVKDRGETLMAFI